MLTAWSEDCDEDTSWDAMGSQWMLDVDTSRETVGSPWDDGMMCFSLDFILGCWLGQR